MDFSLLAVFWLFLVFVLTGLVPVIRIAPPFLRDHSASRKAATPKYGKPF